MRISLWRAVAALVAGAGFLWGGPPPAAAHLLVFKDGFILQGTVKRGSEVLVDPASGARVPIPSASGFYTVEDGVRSIIFSPGQVQDVMREDPGWSVKPIRLVGATPPTIGEALPDPWTIEAADPWQKWARKVRLLTKTKGLVNVPQRVTLLTPQRVRVDALGVNWIAYYNTRELGVETLQTLLDQYFAKTKDSERDKRLLTGKFLLQAGYLDEAERQLTDLVKDFPDQKDKAEPLLHAVKAKQAAEFIDGTELARKAGQYAEVRERLARFPKLGLAPYAGDKIRIQLQDLQNKQQEADDKLKQARHHLEAFLRRLPAERQGLFGEAVPAVLAELNLDTLGRLESFLSQAPSHERDLKQGRKPAQTTDELLALAVSSWLLGEGAGGTDVGAARRLWATRKFLLDYLKTESAVARNERLNSYASGEPLGIDEIARMIRYLPPAEPYEKPGTAPFRLEFTPPAGGQGGTYVVQLPPEYHHQRAYPVLFVLHQANEMPLDMLRRWGDLAAAHGYILVAPEWGGGGGGTTYTYSATEHATVVYALRDLRRRFQVDSDRVFLFGYGQGGQMAYDVGLSHPDLFAGVLPMAAPPTFFPSRYGTNAQFLPFYVVNGERTGPFAKENRALFRDSFVRWNYPSLYVEYKGRGVEWFGAELPAMFDWMGRKKRAHPLRELGRVNYSTGGAGEEFKTMRPTDNRFYWLAADEVQARHCNDVAKWKPLLTPATLQANIFSGNQIHVRTTGINHGSVWLGPTMIDFTKPATLRVNSRQLGPLPVRPNLETLLTDLHQRGDRQQLYFARLSF
jgi:pimeloyl-ACP methyl ester carboxylesterase